MLYPVADSARIANVLLMRIVKLMRINFTLKRSMRNTVTTRPNFNAAT
eukprot:SAG31_NODE_4852_length_2905_cov_3.033143_5_plen_48_part_00